MFKRALRFCSHPAHFGWDIIALGNRNSSFTETLFHCCMNFIQLKEFGHLTILHGSTFCSFKRLYFNVYYGPLFFI